MLALDFDHVELARYLIEQGINVQAMDIHKNTALIRAASRGLTDIVQLLIDHKADVNTQTDKGWSALMLSAKNDYRPTADLLLQNGADLKAKNDNGETAKSFYHKFTLVDSLGYDTPPEPVNGMASIQDELNIPRSASKLGIEGKVVVRAQIDQDGVAVDTQIKESIKNDACDQAAMEAVRAVDWKPAKLKGKAVTAWFDVPVQITTQKKQAKSQPQRPNRPTPAGRDENE